MRGSYLYDGSVSCELCIVLSLVRYGTGDYEDEADIAEDAPIEAYYLYYGSPASQAQFNSGGGGYASLADAMAGAERAPGIGATVRWAHVADRPKPRSG